MERAWERSSTIWHPPPPPGAAHPGRKWATTPAAALAGSKPWHTTLPPRDSATGSPSTDGATHLMRLPAGADKVADADVEGEGESPEPAVREAAAAGEDEGPSPAAGEVAAAVGCSGGGLDGRGPSQGRLQEERNKYLKKVRCLPFSVILYLTSVLFTSWLANTTPHAQNTLQVFPALSYIEQVASVKEEL